MELRTNDSLIQLINDDCLIRVSNIPLDTARLVIADPPYCRVLDEDWDNVWRDDKSYLDWSWGWIESYRRILMPGGLMYIFGQAGKRESVWIHLMSKACKVMEYHDLIIWDRVVGYDNRSDSFNPAYEMALVLRKPGADPYFDKGAVRQPYEQKTIDAYARDKRYKDVEKRMNHLQAGKYATNILSVPSLKGCSKEKVGFPAQKPLALINQIVRSSSAEGDWVIDPFLGSGTTALSCYINKRNCIGIEKDFPTYSLAESRINEYVKSHSGVAPGVETD